MSRANLRNQVLEGLQGSESAMQALLKVDQSHPFFFDHPLDHVPGLLLIEGMAQISQRMAERDGAEGVALRMLEVKFTRYCMLQHPIELRVQPCDTVADGSPLKFVVKVWQQETSRAHGVFEWVSANRLTRWPPAGEYESTTQEVIRCDASSVRKHRIENVMIGVPQQTESMLVAQVLPPHPDNWLADDSHEYLSAIYLLEAFMQSQRYLNGQESRDTKTVAPRLRDSLTGVSIAITQRVAAQARPLIVRPISELTAAKTGRRTQTALFSGQRVSGLAALKSEHVLAECALHSVTVIG
jgi:hypothetical protein